MLSAISLTPDEERDTHSFDLTREDLLSRGELRRPPGIIEKVSSISYLGVELPKGCGGPNVPEPHRFQTDTITQYDLEFMQKIAIAFELDLPVLVEGGSGIGKTRTIERMCAELGWECYYINCHDFEADLLIGNKTVREDTKSGFGWVDGLVARAVRGQPPYSENHCRVLVLDEYNFMRGETRGRLHEIIDALLSRKEKIFLIENDGEVVPVAPGLKIVALQNPPGGRFEDREVLDEAQLTRFHYLKEPTSMPKEVMRDRALGGIGRVALVSDPRELELPRGANLSREQIAEISGIDEVLTRYVEFARDIEQMARNYELAEDQPQPVYFSFQRDYDRVMRYLARHFNGDLNETFRGALDYFYAHRFETPEDKAKVRELIAHVGHFPERNSRRLALVDEGQGVALEDQAGTEPAAQDLPRHLPTRTAVGFLEKALKSGGSDRLIAAALANLDSDDAWKLRERLQEEWVEDEDLIKGLAGVTSDRAFQIRERLLSKGIRPDAIVRSLAGDDSERAWALRDRLTSAVDNRALLDSLAGLNSQRAWEMRVSFAVPWYMRPLYLFREKNVQEYREHVLSGLVGLDTEEAWQMRERLVRKGASLESLTASLAGIDSDRAWERREELITKRISWEAIAKSLIGLDSERAWKMRERIGKKSKPEYVIDSLGGVFSERAWKTREDYLQANTVFREQPARALTGGITMAGIQAARKSEA